MARRCHWPPGQPAALAPAGILHPVADVVLQAIGQLVDELHGFGVRGRPPDTVVIPGLVHVAEVDVLRGGGELVLQELLAQHGQVPVPAGDVNPGQVHAVQQHLAGIGTIQARQDTDQRGLARTVLAHDRNVLTGLDGHGNALDDFNVTSGIAEPDVPQLHRSGRRQPAVFRCHWGQAGP